VKARKVWPRRGGGECVATLILNLGAGGVKWSTSRPISFTVGEESPCCPLHRKFGGRRIGSGHFRE